MGGLVSSQIRKQRCSSLLLFLPEGETDGGRGGGSLIDSWQVFRGVSPTARHSVSFGVMLTLAQLSGLKLYSSTQIFIEQDQLFSYFPFLSKLQFVSELMFRTPPGGPGSRRTRPRHVKYSLCYCSTRVFLSADQCYRAQYVNCDLYAHAWCGVHHVSPW